MTTILLDTSFWDVVWWMIIMFFWVMAIWVFIAVFGDIFRRRDLSGFGKAGWIFLIFILPFLGILIYLIARPRPTDEEIRAHQQQDMLGAYHGGSAPRTSTADIAQAHELLKSGALTQAEFDQIKARALS
jgi:hypothetical protein